MAEVFEERFGPVVLKAIVLMLKDEINLLRAQHGLPDRTNEQVIAALDAKYDSLIP